MDASADAVPAGSIDVAGLSDGDLLDLLSDAGLRHCQRVLAEITRRELYAAIGAIEAIARRHIGFGKERIVAEQAAAIEALASLGGVEAAEALCRLVTRRAFEGPCLKLAMAAAARLDAPLPEEIVIGFLRHDEPEIRAAAAQCTRTWPKATPSLLELLDDVHGTVRLSAACALGRMGRGEARPILMQALRQEPTEAVIEAVVGIWNDDFIVLLGRLAVQRPDMAGAVLRALDYIDHPRAQAVAAGLR